MDSYNMFWNTQGNITQNIDKSHFAYETSMSINWKNKLARKVLLTIMRLFNRPSILDIKTNGVAIWTYENLKNTNVTIFVSGMSAKARGYDESLLNGYKAEFAMPDVLIEESIKADSVLCY